MKVFKSEDMEEMPYWCPNVCDCEIDGEECGKQLTLKDVDYMEFDYSNPDVNASRVRIATECEKCGNIGNYRLGFRWRKQSSHSG